MRLYLEPGWGAFALGGVLDATVEADLGVMVRDGRWSRVSEETFASDATQSWVRCVSSPEPRVFEVHLVDVVHEDSRWLVGWLEGLMLRFELCVRLAPWALQPHARRGLTSHRRHCARAARRWSAERDYQRGGERTCQDCAHFVLTTGAFEPDWGSCWGAGAWSGASVPLEHHCPGLVEESTRVRHVERGSWPVDPSMQCGGCRYFIPLEVPYMEDWGVCSHACSSRDGRVVFEHAGCVAFEHSAQGWGGATPRRHLERLE